MSKLLALLLVLGVLFVSQDLFAQGCPMCKTSLEQARNNGSQVGNTLNNGILYLLALPYLIAATFGFIWYKNKRNKTKTNF